MRFRFANEIEEIRHRMGIVPVKAESNNIPAPVNHGDGGPFATLPEGHPMRGVFSAMHHKVAQRLFHNPEADPVLTSVAGVIAQFAFHGSGQHRELTHDELHRFKMMAAYAIAMWWIRAQEDGERGLDAA